MDVWPASAPECSSDETSSDSNASGRQNRVDCSPVRGSRNTLCPPTALHRRLPSRGRAIRTAGRWRREKHGSAMRHARRARQSAGRMPPARMISQFRKNAARASYSHRDSLIRSSRVSVREISRIHRPAARAVHATLVSEHASWWPRRPLRRPGLPGRGGYSTPANETARVQPGESSSLKRSR